MKQRDGALFEDPWQAAIERSAAIRPPSLRQLYETFELPTGWAAIPFDPPNPNAPTLADVIDTDDDQDWWDEKATRKHYDSMEAPSKARVDAVIRKGATAVGAAFRRTRRGKTRCEVRFDMAGCLRTPKGGSAKQIVVVIAGGALKMRWMSAREYARLQGADDFNITVPRIQAMYGFGDAVCVPAIRWIDRNILTPLYDSHLKADSVRAGA